MVARITRVSTRNVFVTADLLELKLLQDPEELDLHAGAGGADFVEKDGACVGLHELAELVVGGAGKGAGDVAKKLAFEQRLRQRAAGDFDERLVAAPAAAMDGAGDQRLAGAAFAGDEHGGFGVGHAIDHLEDALHAVVVADDVFEAESHIELLAEDLVFFEYAALADGALECHLQLCVDQWLGEEIEGAERMASMAISTVP